MKKLTAIIIAAIMIFALVACTGNQGNAETGKATGTETESATVPATESAEGTESAEPVESGEEVDTASDTGIDGVPNPIEEVDSVEDFEAIGVTKIHAPIKAENVKYSVIDNTIAQIEFEYKGNAYCLRASKEEEDIAGLYGETVAEKDISSHGKLTQIADGENNYYKAEWKRGEVNYTLTNTDGAENYMFIEVYEEVRF